jgi:hypothetical protein
MDHRESFESRAHSLMLSMHLLHIGGFRQDQIEIDEDSVELCLSEDEENPLSYATLGKVIDELRTKASFNLYITQNTGNMILFLFENIYWIPTSEINEGG